MAITNVMTQSLISAGNTMKQIKLQQSVRKELKGKAGVLDSEIKRDEASGADTTAKKEELAETEKKVDDIANKQMTQMSEMNKDMKEAAKADAEEQKRNEKLEAQREAKRAERKKQAEALQEKSAQRAAENEIRLENARENAAEEGTDTVSVGDTNVKTVVVGGAKTKVISESNHATKVPHIDEKITPPTSSEISVSVSDAGGHNVDVKA